VREVNTVTETEVGGVVSASRIYPAFQLLIFGNIIILALHEINSKLIFRRRKIRQSGIQDGTTKCSALALEREECLIIIIIIIIYSETSLFGFCTIMVRREQK
jgi:hypothetical protein